MNEDASSSVAIWPARVPVIGREAELRLLVDFLKTAHIRLITVTGMSGIGKTVVAEEAVRRLVAARPVRVHRVTLGPTPVAEGPESLALTLSGPLALGGSRTSRESEPFGRVVFVDGADSMDGASRLISAALDSDPHLQVLATGVLPLAVRGEQLVPLGPLALPRRGIRDPDRAAASPAVRLFCDRMSAAHAGFDLHDADTAAVVELCIAVDGIPLALELAARSCSSIGVDGFLRLYREHGPDAVTRGSLEPTDRHHSLGQTIERTYSLLSPGAQVLLRRFEVFAGSFDWSAAVTLARMPDGDIDEIQLAADLGSLAECGLVNRATVAERPGQRRYVVAPPVRRFLSERWNDSGERTLLEHRHAVYYRALARQRAAGRFSFGGAMFDHDLVIDRENLLSALTFLESQGELSDALEFAVDLEGMWTESGTAEVGVRHLSDLLAALRLGDGIDRPHDPVLLARALAAMAYLDLWSRCPILGPVAHARLLDARRHADSAGGPELVLRIQEIEVQILIVEGRHDEAQAIVGEALETAHDIEDDYWHMRFLTWASVVANMSGDFARALEAAVSARDIARLSGDDHQLLLASHVLAGVPGASLDPRARPPDAEALLDAARRLGDARTEGFVLIAGAVRHTMTGNKAGAGSSIIEALELARRTGTWYLLQDIALFVLVLTLLVFDRTEEAVELHGAHRALSAMRARLPEAVVSSYEDAIAGARKALGERAFQRLAAVGGLSTQPAVLDRAERRALALIDPASETTPTIPDNGQADESFPGATHNLSRRELEVLRLLASGCSNKDMAALLELRPKTVTHYASNLYRKLEVSGRAQAVSAAWRFGLLEFQE